MTRFAHRLSREEQDARVSWLVRATAHLIAPWAFAVRLPAGALALGASLASSLWNLVPGLLILLAVSFSPMAGRLALFVSIPVFLFTEQPWFAVFLAVLGFVPHAESNAHFAEVSRQVNDVTSDILTEESKYRLAEIPVSETILNAFPTFKGKARRNAWIQKYAKIRDLPDILAFRTPPIRAFRFHPRQGNFATGAAVTFAFDRYSSLIFLRQGFEKLTDAQWLQIYHELAHGTPDGREIILRSYRWSASEKISAVSTLFFWVMLLFLLAGKPASIALWMALLASVFGNFFRFLCFQHIKRVGRGASEVLADSIALTTPQFRANGVWQIRAKNLLTRLEQSVAARPETASLDMLFRSRWLRVWLNRGRIGVYLVNDVDHRIHLAFVLYLLAGALAVPPTALVPWLVWSLVPIQMLHGKLLFARNAMRTETLMEEVDARLTRALRDSVPNPVEPGASSMRPTQVS